MNDANRLAAEEEQLGRWPRRLLHVPSMTSFQWQPGNVYGNIEEPKYNILTYTWGRWRLQDNDEHASEVESLPIAGVPWDIPKISPEHFTANQFLSVIHGITQPLSGRNIPGVEFIWLDVACINQRDKEPDSAAEVGRQAVRLGMNSFVHIKADLDFLPGYLPWSYCMFCLADYH